MRRLLTLITVLLINSLAAQDTIYLRDNSVLAAKVIEIGDAHILYKKADNIAGPDYKLAVQKVVRIVFENGTVEKFHKRYPPRPPQPFRNDASEPSKRVLTILKNKKLYPHSLPDNLLTAGYFVNTHHFNGYYGYGHVRNQIAHGLFVKYERLLANELVGLGVAPFAALNRQHIGAKFDAKIYSKFFGKLRMGVGAYYSMARQPFRDLYYVQDAQEGFTRSGWVSVHNDKATVGSVGFVSNAMLHINKDYLISLGADVGGVVHATVLQGLPENWSRQKPGRGVTVGWVHLGLTRRF
ncbi:hypothetical protein ABDK00_011315 [Niabella insulamsoli]|uniref:hypothetical protein n=1 Tax=Niabella insulamsoli TaxID=3144874 RepID=UPI0031FC690C